MHLKNVNLSDRSLCGELSCCWVSLSLHPWTAALPKSNLPQIHILIKVRCTQHISEETCKLVVRKAKRSSFDFLKKSRYPVFLEF
ncbi:hypothetical protein CKA32_003687 [Geitlerinema sp. FC II]|nr:hypothetical protein CKA32_003687 [Geitlerinema sp. FC II]